MKVLPMDSRNPLFVSSPAIPQVTVKLKWNRPRFVNFAGKNKLPVPERVSFVRY